ncbi:hypothetical protein NMY22_g11358 [Coprinellus aureogranulatus]|nr:hypothetical protein NMY22_g11358 [Coprinellus aureogranulatus]
MDLGVAIKRLRAITVLFILLSIGLHPRLTTKTAQAVPTTRLTPGPSQSDLSRNHRSPPAYYGEPESSYLSTIPLSLAPTDGPDMPFWYRRDLPFSVVRITTFLSGRNEIHSCLPWNRQVLVAYDKPNLANPFWNAPADEDFGNIRFCLVSRSRKSPVTTLPEKDAKGCRYGQMLIAALPPTARAHPLGSHVPTPLSGSHPHFGKILGKVCTIVHGAAATLRRLSDRQYREECISTEGPSPLSSRRGETRDAIAAVAGNDLPFLASVLPHSLGCRNMKFSVPLALVLALPSLGRAKPLFGHTKPVADDVAILNYALTLEHLSSAFYTGALAEFDDHAFVASGFTLEDRQRFVKIAEHEAKHVSFLETTLGGKAVLPCTYKLWVSFSLVVGYESCLRVALAM